MDENDYAEMETIPNLPHYFRPCDGEPVPQDLIGATILNIGTYNKALAMMGGGLIIDYWNRGAGEALRCELIFGSARLAAMAKP